MKRAVLLATLQEDLVMRCAFALAAVGAGSLASAQEWRFELSNPVLSPGNPSTTITASIDPGPGAWALSRANFDVHATEPGWSDPTPLLAMPGQAGGALSGPTVTGISVSQFPDFAGRWPPGYPKLGRVEVWQATFTVSDFAARQIEVNTDTRSLLVYLDPIARAERTPTEAVARIKVVPAPGVAALALVGLGLAAVTRRRRPTTRTPS